MREITREGCGAPDCIYNELFRCTKKTIMVDEGSKCHSLRLKECDEMEHDRCVHCADSYIEHEMLKMVEKIREIEYPDPSPDLSFKLNHRLLVCGRHRMYLKCSAEEMKQII